MPLLLGCQQLLLVGDVGRCGEICGDMRRYAEICGNMRRYAEICGDMRRYAEICGDVGRSQQLLLVGDSSITLATLLLLLALPLASWATLAPNATPSQVGDSCQLPPTVTSRAAAEAGLARSLFGRLQVRLSIGRLQARVSIGAAG